MRREIDVLLERIHTENKMPRKEREAVDRIVAALRPLPHDSRERVVRAALVWFGLETTTLATSPRRAS